MELRLGELLVERGVLTTSQVREILEHQQTRRVPFGVLAERLFDIDPSTVESAWAQQYARLTRAIDPDAESFDDDALALVTRRQAWQFRVVPIRFDDHELMLATTHQHLQRALRFATNVIRVPVYLVMAEADALGRALCEHYPLAGMSPRSVVDDGMDQLLANAFDRA